MRNQVFNMKCFIITTIIVLLQIGILLFFNGFNNEERDYEEEKDY